MKGYFKRITRTQGQRMLLQMSVAMGIFFGLTVWRAMKDWRVVLEATAFVFIIVAPFASLAFSFMWVSQGERE